MIKAVFLVLVGALFAPFLGGFLAGLDRRVTARMQARLGPPLLQPFYDAAKLLGKDPALVNARQTFCAWVYLGAVALSAVLFFLQSDLLLIFFVHAVGSVMLAVGAMASPSPYSQVGAQRELIQVLAYEPLLALVFVGVYLKTGSFMIAEVYDYPSPLLLKMPLLYLVLTFVLTVKLRKSPFDFSASHHAHQELVRGFTTDYSGPYLALIEIGHWYETVLILGLCSLFWATSWTGMAVLLAVTYAAEILVDNISARLTWRIMLGYAWSAGLTLSVINLVWLYAG